MESQKPTEEVVKTGVAETVAPTTDKPELNEEQISQLKKQREFFFRMRQGGYFLKFIYNDIERQKKEHLNRPQRRRFEKELRKGVFSKELVEVYTAQIEQIEAFIESQLNPKPAQEVDGAQFYADLKAKEAKGELKEPETKA